MSKDVGAEETDDFSLVLGGPLFQLFRRGGLCGGRLERLGPRIIFMSTLMWLPLLVLALVEGHALGGSVNLPFLYDVEAHLRFLLAVPLLILAEVVVYQRMRPVVKQFTERGLIPDEERAKFDAAIASANRLRNSVTAEVLLLGLVYGVGVLVVWRTQVSLDIPSWYGVQLDGRLQPSMAGWWLGCVSLPLLQFLCLRWYFRLFIWGRFLWQVSRIGLKLMPTNPDRCGGLGFLSVLSSAFWPLLLSQGTILAGMIAERIIFKGAALPDFKLELIGMVALLIFFVLGPLLVFTPKLASAKRIGLLEYGTLAQHYGQEFDRKWLRGGAADEPLIGSADIQSLADMGNSFAAVKEMKLIPIPIQTFLQLALTTLLPIGPLLVSMIPLEELLGRLLKVLF